MNAASTGSQPPVAFDVDLVVTVDHDLGDAGIAQIRLERAVAEDLVGDLLRDARTVGRGHRGVVALQYCLQGLRDLLFEFVLVEVSVVQLGTKALQQTLVHAALHAGERVRVPRCPARYVGRRLRTR